MLDGFRLPRQWLHVALVASLLFSSPLLADGDSTVVINEIQYHPRQDEAGLEWIELYNQMGVDMDLSEWSLSRGVQYVIPDGTVIAAGGYLVIASSPAQLAAELGFVGALGPFTGRLDNSGEAVELRDKNFRLMSRVRFRDEDGWPVAADGSGVTLAKRHGDLASDAMESWTQSAQVNGTPGRINFAVSRGGVTVPDGAISWWRFDGDGSEASDAFGNNTGTLGSGADRVPGIVGDGALSFDNSVDAFVNLGAGVNNDFSVTTGITVEALLRPEWSGLSGEQDTIFRKEDGLNRILLAFQHDDVDFNRDVSLSPAEQPTLAFGIQVGGTYSELDMPLDGDDGRPTLASLTDGSAHHVAATYDSASGRKSIWVDGVRVFSADLGPGELVNSGGGSTAYIGNMSGRVQPFDGVIDEVVFWSRALRAEEIAAHHGAFLAGRDYFSVESSDPDQLPLRINEISPTTQGPSWIELINVSEGTVSLRDWAVERQGILAAEYVFAAEGLAAGATIVLDEDALGFDLPPGDKIFLWPPARTAVADAVEVKLTPRARLPDGTGELLAPSPTTPGAANQFDLRDDIVISEIQYHPRELPAVPAVVDSVVLVPVDAVWRYDQSGVSPGAAWMQPGFADGGWQSGAALLYVENSELPAPKNTELELGPVTFYFRRQFVFDGEPGSSLLTLRTVVDDGAVVYLNGQEVFRLNMPEGPIGNSTTAQTGVSNAAYEGPFSLPTDSLVQGTNTLAVEVHQATTGSSDVVFGLELSSDVVLEEAMPFGETTEEWIELYNRGSGPIDLSDWSIDGGIGYDFAAGTSIAAGERLVVARDQQLFRDLHPGVRVVGDFTGVLSNAGDLIRLEDERGNPVDEVNYRDDWPWPWAADGGGASLELIDLDADNSMASAWGASDESGRTAWRTYSYRQVATANIGPTQWREFVVGLLDQGEMLIDDLSVVESPGGANTQMISNGSFQSGSSTWRFIGNHRHSRIVDDPDQAGNRVLHLVATGPTEHMHNHLETTLAGGRSVTNGRTYEISFRARWIAGSNQLNTRLYFNRAPRTTRVDVPDRIGTPGAANSIRESDIGPTLSALRHEPPVPAASEDIEISAIVHDPDGIAACRVWYSVNEAAWVSRAMSSSGPADGLEGAEIWAGSIPGQSSGRSIQFYIEAEDTSGLQSTLPAEGRDSRAMIPVDDGLARLTGKHNLRIVLPSSEANFLHERIQVMSNDRLPCTVIYDESEVYYGCGVRLKGSERGRGQSGRVGFNVRFPADHLFRGVHRTVSIDRSGGYALGTNHGQDEILVKHMIQHAGDIPGTYDDIIRIIAPRSAQTGNALLQMARFGSVYLDAQFENGGDGTVFEYELIYYPRTTDADGFKLPEPDSVLGVDLQDHGDDKEIYRWNFLVTNNRERDDYESLIPFLKAMSLSGSALEANIPDFMDVDEWMRVFAMQSLTGIGDTYSRGNNHNLRLYARPSDGRVLAFPWDWDFAFTQSSSSALWGNQRIANVITRPPFLHLYYGHLLDIIQTTFNRDYMSSWTSHYAQKADGNYGTFLNYIGSRESFVRGRLPASVAFDITTNGGNALSVDTAEVTLEGDGWIDVVQIVVSGLQPVLPVEWTALTEWRLDVPLVSGVNDLQLFAFDRQGRIVGSDEIRVTTSFVPPAPSVASIEPAFAAVGEVVDISGSDFFRGAEVFFDGVPAEVTHHETRTMLSVVVPAVAPGSVAVTVRNLGGASSNPIQFSVVAMTAVFTRGDTNLDGNVDVSDPVRLLRHLFAGLEIFCQDAADADDDESLTITDAIRVLDYLFRAGLAPAPPFPGVGPDLTDDPGLGCDQGIGN